MGPSHQWRHKSRVSLRGPRYALNVLGICHGEVGDTNACVGGLVYEFGGLRYGEPTMYVYEICRLALIIFARVVKW